MTKKLELIDFLRGFAIFTIAMMHLVQGSLTGALNKAAAFGGAGVHVFILVSGFGLYLSYLRKPLGYGEFLKKRFGKVYWPYAIAVISWMLWILVSRGTLMWQEVLSHLLLYKMFIHDLDVSFCYPYWFISTIIQFYLCWPLIVRVARVGGGNSSVSGYGLLISGLISLSWATVVGLLGYEEFRPWGSCFLQYLWEFVLGMYLAEKYARQPEQFDISQVKWIWILLCAVVGIGLTGFMGWKGGILKLYNDIPSLMGYLSCLLIVYKLGVKYINKFFIWSSGFGYELYLAHSLVYSIVYYFTIDILSLSVRLTVCAVGAYVTGWCYHEEIKRMR